MNKIIILSLCLLLQGCQTLYIHPNKTQDDFFKDKYDCEQDAVQFSHNFAASGNPLIIQDRIKQCLEQKYGWQRCNNCKK